MSGAPLDPRTAVRAELLRRACSLPIARVHGSFVGRPAGQPREFALEPGGRHAAVIVAGAVERWDLVSVLVRVADGRASRCSCARA